MTSLKYSPISQSNPEHNFSRFHDTYFTKELLKRLDKYKDDQETNLQQSIPILYELNIFQQLQSIPQAKKKLTQEGKPNSRLQLQARFIYNLWNLISRDQVPMKYFKQLITLFITEQISDLASKLQQIFENRGSLVIQILAIWQAMLQNNSHHSSYQQYKESSVLTQDAGNLNNSQDFYKDHKKSNSNMDSKNYSIDSLQRNRISLNKRQKQNQRHLTSKNNQTFTERPQNKTRRQNIEEVKNEIFNSNFYEIPVLTVQKQKQLISRLYVVNKYERYQQIKKMQDQQKLMKQMEQCTFRPNLQRQRKRPDTANKNKTTRTNSKTIPGFQKAIERMKVGQQKTKELKQKLQLRNINVKYSKQQNLKAIIPPKFLTRQNKKDQKKVLFTIQFDIGRHKLTCKIHQNDSSDQLAKNIQSIYSLKQDSYEQIKGIMDQQMHRYFELHEEQAHSQDIALNQQKNNEPAINDLQKQKSYNYINY